MRTVRTVRSCKIVFQFIPAPIRIMVTNGDRNAPTAYHMWSRFKYLLELPVT